MIQQVFIISFLFFLVSCVPTKDMMYLKGDPTFKSNIYQINDEPYKFQIHDIISVGIKSDSEIDEKLLSVFQNKTNSNSNSFSNYTIDRHGNIRLPRIGDLNVLGYTANEVRFKIEAELSRNIRDMEAIFVTVELAGIRFSINGEIRSPGTKTLNQKSVTILDAIGAGGGVLLTGKMKEIEVWRNTISGKKKLVIDLTKSTAFDSEAYYIQPNDIIVVNPLRQKSWGIGTTGLQSFTTILSVFSIVTSTILIIRSL